LLTVAKVLEQIVLLQVRQQRDKTAQVRATGGVEGGVAAVARSRP